MANNSEKKSKNSDQEILRIARERFELAVEAELDIRKLALEDLEFRAGDQWPDDIKADRDLEKRPCLTINKIPQFVRQITNDQRQNRSAIKVFPVDDAADKETARIYQGLIRHIEYDSNAELAYDKAFEQAVVSGFGYFRIYTDYTSPMSFEQDIKIGMISNQFSVYLDPHAKEADRSDTNWGFIFEDVPADDYKAEYKDSDLTAMSDWNSIGDQNREWVSKSSVRVAEYFCKEYKTVSLVQLNDEHGTVIEKSQLPPDFPKQNIAAERTTNVPQIKWYKINGIEILERTDWKGQWIPIIPVLGDELNVDGKRILEGIVRHAKDPQRMYNYWVSTETETIALAPKAPFIIEEGQVSGYEAMWQEANTRSHSYLPYVHVEGAPMPSRNAYEPPVQAITNARMQSSEDMKATTGIYDASLGAKSNENSGVAIQRRNNQSQTSNFHFIDNLTRSKRHAGRVIVDLIPHTYDTARTARIIGEEDQQEVIKLNQEFNENGEVKAYNMNVGKYDVIVETGPSFATKRQESAAAMIDIAKTNPQVMALAGDLVIKNLDVAGAEAIAERLKKGLPPGIAEDDKTKKQIPPEIQGQMKQMDQMVAQLTEQTKKQTEIINQKTNELESKERIELKKLENALVLKQMDLQGQAANALFLAELKSISSRLGLVDINQPIGAGQVPEQPQQQPQQDFNGSGLEQAVNQNVPQNPGELAPQQ